MAGCQFSLALLIGGTNGDVATFLNEAIGGLGEERAVLNVVVADQAKGGALGEHGYVVVKGAVAKVVRKTRTNTVAVNELKELTVAKDSAGLRTEDQKGVAGALEVVDGDRWGWLGYAHRM